jgi:hypothetical protein
MLVPAKPVPPSPVQGAPSVLLKIEERLANAVSPQEVVLSAQVRGEILRQDDQRDLQRRNQSSERIRLLTKSGLTLLATVAGIVLVVENHFIAGMFTLGAGLYGIASPFVMTYFPGSKRARRRK